MDNKNRDEGSGFTLTPKERSEISITPKEKPKNEGLDLTITPKEDPKLTVIAKERPEIKITPKKKPKIEIREIFKSQFKEMIGEHGNDTLRIIPGFGQTWNLANLKVEDVYYFGTHFGNEYRQGNDPEMESEIRSFYNTLVRLNPELGNIETGGNMQRILDVIRGVGSGLHFNDIKYFVEVLQGNAENTPEEDQALEWQALEAFYLRNGLSAVEFDEQDTKKIEAEIDAIDKSYGLESLNFALSPETSRRVIENRPYKEG